MAVPVPLDAPAPKLTVFVALSPGATVTVPCEAVHPVSGVVHASVSV